MKIKYNDIDITNYILEYKRKANVDDDEFTLLGNTPSTEVDIKVDNTKGVIQGLGIVTVYNGEILKGTYFVYDAPESYTGIVSLTCFDKMLYANVPYDSRLSYPVTIKDQLDEIKSLTGLSIDYSNLPVLDQTVNQWDNTLSCRNYIGWIAEIGGMNAYADTTGDIKFKPLPGIPTWTTNDVESFEQGEDFVITRVCYDDGILKILKGDETGNTLWLSSNNPYVDTIRNPVERIYNLYKGMSLRSVKSMKVAGLDDLQLFDIVEYQSIKYMCLGLTSSYKGGTYQIQNLKGSLPTASADKVTIKFDAKTSIKKISVDLDKTKQSLDIVAESVDGANEQLAKLHIDMDKISQSVSSTEEKVEIIEASKRYKLIAFSSNGTAFQNGNTATNLSCQLMSWDDDITDIVKDSEVTWKCYKSGTFAWSKIGKTVNIANREFTNSALIECTWNGIRDALSLVNVQDGAEGQDAVLLCIDSSNGSIFKNSGVATTLTVTVIVAGQRLDTSQKLRDYFGPSASLGWEYKRLGELVYNPIPKNDPRLSDDGFIFTLNPRDIDTKHTFNCNLDY